MTQRREHDRIPYPELVEYFEWNHRRIARARELGVRGLFLQTPSPSGVGTLITVRLKMPEKVFTRLARVVRATALGTREDAGMAVEFVDEDAEAKDAIERYIRSKAA